MSTIEVKFGNVTLPNVVSVAPGTTLLREQIIGVSLQNQARTVEVNGFVSQRPRTALAQAQKDFTDALAGESIATLQYPGAPNFTARVTNISWQEWNGNPMIAYTATFVTDEENPFSRDVYISGNQLVPTPNVSDTFTAHSEDDRISATKEKEIVLSGIIQGTTAAVNTMEANIISWLTTADTVTVTIASGVYVCRVESFEFSTPDATEEGIAKTYEVELATYPDWTLEDFHSGSDTLNIVGISIDVTSSLKHSVSRDSTDSITSETLSVSGKKYFNSFTECNNFKNTVDAKVVSKTTMTSLTGLQLVVKNASWNEPVRDGHFPSGNKRYSISFSLDLEYDSGSVQLNPGTVLSVVFDDINSLSYSASIDGDGNVITRTKSGSGKVAPASIPVIRPGVAVAEDGYLYYVTSLSFGAKDSAGLQQTTVSGQTLDTAGAADDLVPKLFSGYFFDHVTSQSKSVSYQWNKCEEVYKAVSESYNISGFRLNDDGNILNLITTLDRLAEQWIFTSVSVSEQTKVNHKGVTQVRFPVSTSAIRYMVRPEDCEQPEDIKQQLTRTIDDATAKFATITVPGLGVVYKKIGVNPQFETVTVTNTAKNEKIYSTMPFPADPGTTLGVNSYKIKRQTKETKLQKSVTIKYQKYTATSIPG